MNNLLYALTLLVVSHPVYLLDTVEVASAAAIIWLQKHQISIRNNKALENLAFCKDICMQVNQDTIDDLISSSVKIVLLSQEDKSSMITMLLTKTDELVEDIESGCMTGEEFIQLTCLCEK